MKNNNDSQTEHEQVFIRGIATLGVSISNEMMDKFRIYERLLLRWNSKINLTAIRDSLGIWERHFFDSLAISPLLEPDITCADIGSGAGFPGIPLGIASSDVNMELWESNYRKAAFLREVSAALELGNVRVRQQKWCETEEIQYNVLISRATFPLSDWLQKGCHGLVDGGMLIAMIGKKQGCFSEVLSRSDGRKLRVVKKVNYKLPASKAERGLLVFKQE